MWQLLAKAVITELISARFIIAFSIIWLFGYAYLDDPTDDTMKGALIAAFAGAWGFYLGSTITNHQMRNQVGDALDLAKRNQPDVSVDKADEVVIDGERKI